MSEENVATPGENNEEQQEEGLETFAAEYVKQLRAENAKYRTERNALQEKVKTFEQEKLTKEEQAAQRLKELEERESAFISRMRGAELRAAVAGAANGLKISSVDAAMKLLDAGMITFDEENHPVGVEAALGQLVKQYPFLVTAPPSSGDKTNPERGRQSALTLDDVKKMTPNEINSRWDEVSAVIKG